MARSTGVKGVRFARAADLAEASAKPSVGTCRRDQ